MNFLQELMYLLINQSFPQLVATGTALSQKKDQVGGTVWKPSNYRNLLLTTIEAFDLVDIQRVRHLHLRKYSF